MASLALALKGLSAAQKQKEEQKAQLQNNVNQLLDGAGGLGALLQQMALKEDGRVDEKQSTFGGALQGLNMGSSFGPIGALIGATLGGTTGFSSAASANEDFYDTKRLKDELELEGKSYSPSINQFSDGGFVVEDVELEPAQLDKDEHYVTSDLSIYESKSKEEHEDMDNYEVTDFLKPRSFVFSKRKEFKPSEFADDNLGYGFAYYEEDGSDFDLEEIKMGDVLGDSKKPISFSDGIKKIKKQYEVKGDGDKHADMFTKITDKENKIARTPFVNHLIKMHGDEKIDERLIDDNNEKLKPKKYGTGGFTDMRKEIQKELDEFKKLNKESYEQAKQEGENIFNSLQGRNAASSLVNMFATGMQSTRVDPDLQEDAFADSMYEEMSPAVVDNLRDEQIRQANSFVANIARVDPEQAGLSAGRLLDRSLNAANDVSLRALESNMEQRRGKYKYLNKIRNYNRSARNKAKEKTRSLINKKRSQMASQFAEHLSTKSALDRDELKYNRENRGNYLQNRLSALNKEIEMSGADREFQAEQDHRDQMKKYYKESLQRNMSEPLGINFDNVDSQMDDLDIYDEVEGQSNDYIG